jgi:hypothetical protein
MSESGWIPACVRNGEETKAVTQMAARNFRRPRECPSDLMRSRETLEFRCESDAELSWTSERIDGARIRYRGVKAIRLIS